MSAASFLSPILRAGPKSEEGVHSQVIDARVSVFPKLSPRASICLRPTEISKSSLSLIVAAIRSLPKKLSLTSAHRFTLDALLPSLLPLSSSSSSFLYAILLSASAPQPSFLRDASPSIAVRRCVLGDAISALALEAT